jgi:hypothetical protein
MGDSTMSSILKVDEIQNTDGKTGLVITPDGSIDGIKFPEEANPSGRTITSTTMSSYEEGYWTLTLVNSEGVTNIADQKYNTYTKVGNTVHLRGHVNFSAASSSGYAVNMAGLPFTASADSAVPGSCFDRFGAGFPIAPYVSSNSDSISFYQMGTSKAISWNHVGYIELGAFSAHFAVSYFIDE